MRSGGIRPAPALRSAGSTRYTSGMTITEVAREMLASRTEARDLDEDGLHRPAQVLYDRSETARAEIERRLTALFADGAR